MLSKAREKIKNWYERYERIGSVAAMVGGFILDSLTLRRVDYFAEDAWLTVLLGLSAIAIFLLTREERGEIEESVPGRLHFWLLLVLQFAVGGLLSAFLVFYSRSATIASGWPFLAVLVFAMIGNEIFKSRYSRLTFRLGVFFVCLYLFSIFLVPVIIHQLGTAIFLLSGVVSITIFYLYILFLKKFTAEHLRKNLKAIIIVTASITAAINILYFTELIPPIPLALKSGGVYHTVTKDAQGKYHLKGEERSLLYYVGFPETFHNNGNEMVTAFSSVFSPTALNTTIVHHWQRYDERAGEWQTESKVYLPIFGGRNDGYRTYSQKNGLIPGRWRVDVETPRGADIGRIKFDVEDAAGKTVVFVESVQ